jgi:hypothetical protein
MSIASKGNKTNISLLPVLRGLPPVLIICPSSFCSVFLFLLGLV